jgi:hypothetical protein
VKKGWLFIFPSFQFMVKRDLDVEDFRLEGTKGGDIPAKLVTVKSKEKTVYGAYEFEQRAFDLGGWYKKHGVHQKDNLLATILDWEIGRFQLQPESAREYNKHRAEIQAQNQALADHLFQQLEAARYEYIRGDIAIPTAYLHLKASNAYPAGHWLEVLEQDPRMQWDGYDIRYADWRSPFKSFIDERDQQTRVEPKPLSNTQAEQVYRFKASLWHRKSLWRRIEIQGRQTLSDFDDIIRTAFQHDHWDHLSGFWKLVRRGQSRRFREVDLGTIYPTGEGEAADIPVASLSLTPGDALKYVYDFGDWIQHRLELEAVGEPEEKATYPFITGQNKPRDQDCQVCKVEGRKTIATLVCYTCSNKEQRDILLCETCAQEHDEEHYLEEILY